MRAHRVKNERVPSLDPAQQWIVPPIFHTEQSLPAADVSFTEQSLSAVDFMNMTTYHTSRPYSIRSLLQNAFTKHVEDGSKGALPKSFAALLRPYHEQHSQVANVTDFFPGLQTAITNLEIPKADMYLPYQLVEKSDRQQEGWYDNIELESNFAEKMITLLHFELQYVTSRTKPTGTINTIPEFVYFWQNMVPEHRAHSDATVVKTFFDSGLSMSDMTNWGLFKSIEGSITFFSSFYPKEDVKNSIYDIHKKDLQKIKSQLQDQFLYSPLKNLIFCVSKADLKRCIQNSPPDGYPDIEDGFTTKAIEIIDNNPSFFNLLSSSRETNDKHNSSFIHFIYKPDRTKRYKMNESGDTRNTAVSITFLNVSMKLQTEFLTLKQSGELQILHDDEMVEDDEMIDHNKCIRSMCMAICIFLDERM